MGAWRNPPAGPTNCPAAAAIRLCCRCHPRPPRAGRKRRGPPPGLRAGAGRTLPDAGIEQLRQRRLGRRRIRPARLGARRLGRVLLRMLGWIALGRPRLIRRFCHHPNMGPARQGGKRRLGRVQAAVRAPPTTFSRAQCSTSWCCAADPGSSQARRVEKFPPKGRDKGVSISAVSTIPDLRCTAPQELRAAPRPGKASGPCGCHKATANR